VGSKEERRNLYVKGKTKLCSEFKKRNKEKRMKKEKELKAGIYYRVSTREKQDIGMQQKACRDYCKRENIKIIKEEREKGNFA